MTDCKIKSKVELTGNLFLQYLYIAYKLVKIKDNIELLSSFAPAVFNYVDFEIYDSLKSTYIKGSKTDIEINLNELYKLGNLIEKYYSRITINMPGIAIKLCNELIMIHRRIEQLIMEISES